MSGTGKAEKRIHGKYPQGEGSDFELLRYSLASLAYNWTDQQVLHNPLLIFLKINPFLPKAAHPIFPNSASTTDLLSFHFSRTFL